jgi:transposase-like protein
MKRVHRKHSADFKSKVAIEALKEQKTLAQISEQYALHANQISDWKKVLLEGSSSLFEKETAKGKTSTAIDLDAYQAMHTKQAQTYIKDWTSITSFTTTSVNINP